MDRKCEPLAGRASSGSRAHLLGCLSVDYASASAARSRHLHRPLSKQKLLSGQSARHTISGRTASAQCQSLVEVQQLPKPLMSKATLRVWLPACECAHLPLPGQNHHRRILRRLLHKPPRNACPSALSVVKQASFVDPYRLVLVGDVFPDEVSEHLVECSEASCKPNT